MAVYVDHARHRFGRMRMNHMVADTLSELHHMADRIGIRRRWFQDKPRFPHYDICESKRELAIKHGAIPVTGRDIVHVCRKAYGCRFCNGMGVVVKPGFLAEGGMLSRERHCTACEGSGRRH